MFSIAQINEASNAIKTGADFPQFASRLREMGVKRSDFYVMTGMAIYFGSGDETVESPPIYENLLIEQHVDDEQLRSALKNHQEGKTDFRTFCREAAMAGVEKWIIDLEKAKITYLDATGNEVVVEFIPI